MARKTRFCTQTAHIITSRFRTWEHYPHYKTFLKSRLLAIFRVLETLLGAKESDKPRNDKKKIHTGPCYSLDVWNYLDLATGSNRLSGTPNSPKIPLLRASTDWTNSNLIELTLSTAIFFVFGKLLSRKQKSICWSALKAQLNTLQRYVCTNSGNEIHDNNRVTLFRYKKICFQAVRVKSFASMWKDGCWPWTGWLVPVLRSGHTSQNTNALFWVPDDGRKSEGIAGQCWSQSNTVYIDRLPNVNSCTSLPNTMEAFKFIADTIGELVGELR